MRDLAILKDANAQTDIRTTTNCKLLGAGGPRRKSSSSGLLLYAAAL
jgi:hypothetical protein